MAATFRVLRFGGGTQAILLSSKKLSSRRKAMRAAREHIDETRSSVVIRQIEHRRNSPVLRYIAAFGPITESEALPDCR